MNDQNISLPIQEASDALQNNKGKSWQQLPNLHSHLIRQSKSSESVSDYASTTVSQLPSARGSQHDLSKSSSHQRLPDQQVANVITPVQMLALVGQMHNKPQGNFAQKLYKILNDNFNQKHLFDWTTNGSSFVVFDTKEFEEHVLPKYFKHSKFSSFVRQLNIYGFAKVSKNSRSRTSFTGVNENNIWEFQHPLFQRDHPELLDGVSMKNKSKQIDTSVAHHSDSSSQAPSPEMAQVKAALASQNTQIVDLQKALTRSNAELMQQRKRQIVQQSILKQVYEYAIEPHMKDQMPFDVLERSILNIVEQQMQQQQQEAGQKRPYDDSSDRRPVSSGVAPNNLMNNVLKGSLRASASEGQSISKLGEVPMPDKADLSANTSNSTSMSSVQQRYPNGQAIPKQVVPSLATSPLSPLANQSYTSQDAQQQQSQKK